MRVEAEITDGGQCCPGIQWIDLGHDRPTYRGDSYTGTFQGSIGPNSQGTYNYGADFEKTSTFQGSTGPSSQGTYNYGDDFKKTTTKSYSEAPVGVVDGVEKELLNAMRENRQKTWRIDELEEALKDVKRELVSANEKLAKAKEDLAKERHRQR